MRAVVLSPQCYISVPSIHIGAAANVKNVVIPCHVMSCHKRHFINLPSR